MPASQESINFNLTFALAKSTTGFGDVQLVPTTETFSLSGINLATWNQVFAAQYTIASAGTQDFDLSSFTNLIGEATGFGHVLSMLILPTITSMKLTPNGPTNPLLWFFGSTADSLTIKPGGIFTYSATTGDTGNVVDGSHKNMRIVNVGTTTGTATIVVFGSTG